MKKILAACLAVCLFSCQGDTEPIVYYNDGNDELWVVSQVDGFQGEMIQIENWQTLTIDPPNAYVETSDETIIFSLNDVAFVIDH